MCECVCVCVSDCLCDCVCVRVRVFVNLCDGRAGAGKWAAAAKASLGC